ncbi:peptidase M14, carboxypeptidase A [Tolypothrix tenuis PCC 7101]|uniref:Peptidase M14, carboxypeptidase A n=1 Tax=Tolypothrix tenuis PCC 7101 TaxID=231146 RepID=A0A1Z4MRM2_9CYAN|nr:carboxypeptidase [Aulosira sp. FACHB-113]BAY96130.1 peptidase M14, carboxypeptidase A [Tolypothrix tenuis PCC 7101]BAZ73363.1 peptidase M14, carboxypeptidase A [Aulosira laxa NIES-50]
MPDVRFNKYYRYAELTNILHSYAEEFPHLVRIESIGKSYENRDIWLLTVTNFTTGTDAEKPALWVDGNIHATELAPSIVCLYLLQTLVTAYGTQADITRCLDSRTFYICPRVNPDGAEWALADKPKFIRSATRPYPEGRESNDGLIMEDIDGDGRILLMRIPDANGAWKICPSEPRLLMRREPTEIGGQYYRVLPEGSIENYDGVQINIQPPQQGLDLNRNFPVMWRQEFQQLGAGPYPASETEVRSLVQFITNHPNITGAVSFHTFGGVIIRPFSYHSDDEFPVNDLRTYQYIGQKGADFTTYPAISAFHDFRYDPKDFISGTFDDWAYDERGIFAWTVEVWSPQNQAGIKDYQHVEWQREHSLEDELKLLRWNDEQLSGKGYVDWYAFDHPQLGQVELGGWNTMYAWVNPPPEFLEREIALFPDWLVWHLLISPRLEIYQTNVHNLGNDIYQVELVVQNTGWLPTYITQKALEKKLVKGCICEIQLPDSVTLITGKLREELGQLEGRAYKPSYPTRRQSDPTQDRAKVKWVVRGSAGSKVQLLARHERAGVVRAEIILA